MSVTWEDVEKYANKILGYINEMDELGFKGLFGRPVRDLIPIFNYNYMSYIEGRFGDPERMMKELKGYARDVVYGIAEANTRDRVMKKVLKEWNRKCISICAYDEEKEAFICSINVFEDGLKSKGMFEIPSSKHEPVISQFKRVVSEVDKRGCAYFDRRTGLLFSKDRFTDIYAEAEKYLEKLKRELEI